MCRVAQDHRAWNWLRIVILCHTLSTHPDLGKPSRHGMSYRLSYHLSLCFPSFSVLWTPVKYQILSGFACWGNKCSRFVQLGCCWSQHHRKHLAMLHIKAHQCTHSGSNTIKHHQWYSIWYSITPPKDSKVSTGILATATQRNDWQNFSAALRSPHVSSVSPTLRF